MSSKSCIPCKPRLVQVLYPRVRGALAPAIRPDSFARMERRSRGLGARSFGAAFPLPLSARIALESTRLGPRFHRDPADQIITATARVHGLRLVTADGRIRASGVVAVV